MSQIRPEIDVWTCPWPVEGENITGAYVQEPPPGPPLTVDFHHAESKRFERLNYVPFEGRKRFPLDNIVTGLTLPYADPGSPDEWVSVRIWRDRGGLKIAFGRSLLAIGFPEGGDA
jgi:hypothetical protein